MAAAGSRSSAPAQLQFRALLGKSFTAQKRNLSSNLFLLVGPIIFCLLLWALQRATNTLLETNEDLKCACRCTRCCRDVRVPGRGWQRQCTDLQTGYCDRFRGFTCEATDDTQCGVQYSSSIQAIWCPIPEPSTWPPVVATPRPRYYAKPYGPWKSLPLLYTSDPQGYEGASDILMLDRPAAWPTSNQSRAARAATRMLRGPAESLRLLGTDPRTVQDIFSNIIAGNGTVFNGHLLSLLGLTFAHARRPPSQYYVDPAFANTGTDDELDTLVVLLPNGTCASRNMTFIGGDNRNATSFPLLEFLIRLYKPLVPTIEQLLNSSGVNQQSLGASSTLFSAVKVGCVDAPTVWMPDADVTDATLYCGWRRAFPQPNAQCFKATQPNRGFGTAESYSFAMNWMEPATPAGLALDITFNISWPGTGVTERNKRLPALVNLGVRGWVEANLPAGAAQGNELLGVASFPKPTDKLRLDFSSLLGPLFYSWTAQLLLPTMLQQLVYEKEKRLRMMMKMHGLSDGVYWQVTYLWYLLVYCVYMAVFMIAGSALGLKFFTKNSYGIQVVFLFLFGQTQLAFTFLLSALFRSTRTAVVAAYLLVLATGLMGYLLLDPLMDFDKWWMWLVELLPAFALYRGLYELGSYAFLGVYRNEVGMQWSNLGDDGNGMVVAWIILAVEWPVFMLLAWYLEQVVPTGNGVPRHPLFFLKPITRHLACCLKRRAAAATQPDPHAGLQSADSGPLGASGPSLQPSESARALIIVPHGVAGSAAAPRGAPDATPPSGTATDSSPGTPAGGAAPPAPGAAAQRSQGSDASGSSGVVVGGGVGGGLVELAVGGKAVGPRDVRVAVPHGGALAAGVASPSGVGAVAGDALLASPAAGGGGVKAGGGKGQWWQRAGAAGGGLSDKQRELQALKGYTFEDVQAERDRVQDMLDASGTQLLALQEQEAERPPHDVERPGGDASAAAHLGVPHHIVAHWLRKRFDTPTGPREAVRELSLAIAAGECFGLLGPNGAGKTSTIHMLTGLLTPTGGDAWVRGYRITTDMQEIYKLMGVCPQHDLLWEQLTGREHLRFYGRLKGLAGSELEGAIDEALKGVNLFNVGNKFAGKYSGGMKRRLSVAISFIGSPKVVYLDEPSTGLDPASRRNLWDMVKTNKQDRAIILTTHSMQEAEMLCDRLGIFVDGQLVCIGTPKQITSRYAGFLVFTITVPASQEQAARDLVTSLSPNAVLTYALGGTLKYELPSSEVTLSQVFAAVNHAKDGGLEVVDWGVANASLENVFIKLAKDLQLNTERMD